MSTRNPQFVLSRYSPIRIDDIEKVYLHAVSGAEPFVLGVLGPPDAGTSEVLRGTFDRLFLDQRFVVPFYFAVRAGDGDARSAAARYLYEFILQAVAFRRRDADLAAAKPDICELRDLAPLSDADWVSKLCEECDEPGLLNDDRAFVRSAIAAPMRAAASAGMRVCMIIDDLHEAISIRNGDLFLDEIAGMAEAARMPVVIGAHRKFRHGIELPRTNLIEPLTTAQAGDLADEIARSLDVGINEPTRDLLAVQTDGRLSFIGAVLAAARERRVNLEDYRTLEQIYSELVMFGGIGAHFDECFALAAVRPGVRRKLIDQLRSESLRNGGDFPLAALIERIGVDAVEFERIVRSLESDEILDVDGDRGRLSGSLLVADHLRTRGRTTANASPAAALGDLVADSLKRAPKLMTREYRRIAAVGLKEILSAFDMQEVPRGLLDYRIFRERAQGEEDDAALAALFADDDRFTLPQIAHAVPLAEYLPAFAGVTEPERAVAARGFATRAYTDEDEIAWLAAEIDSKLEADEGLTREWIDRMENAAREIGLENFRIWLVAPEGFSQAALDHLAYRNTFGSSRRQVEMLRQRLTGGPAVPDEGLKEFEMVIPVGDDTELIAAHALEEIARRYDFPAKTVNQMKTALIEACINAAEHGLSPDLKIYQKFAVSERKVVITVSNRGLRLTDRVAAGAAQRSDLGEGRRGWGLNLIRTLMDDVRVEPVDDGTRIIMTKLIPAI